MLFNRPFFQKVLLCACFASSINAFAGEHLVTSKYGEVQVNDNIKRVVTLSEEALDSAIAVGVHPIATVSSNSSNSVATYLKDQANDIPVIGNENHINIKAVAAKRPDLILAPTQLSKEQYQQLSKIAPTIVPIPLGVKSDNWINVAEVYAQALNDSDQMNILIDIIKNRASDMKNVIDTKLANGKNTATVAQWTQKGPTIIPKNAFSSSILTRTGFNLNPTNEDKPDQTNNQPLNLEHLSKIDSDWLFLMTSNSAGANNLKTAEKSPEFSNLDVVKEKHVVKVDNQLWDSASGPLAARAILDDIQTMMDTVSYP